jgi:hypothetical protein
MKITHIEKHVGSGMWHGTAVVSGKNHTWYFPTQVIPSHGSAGRNKPALLYEHRSAGRRAAGRVEGDPDSEGLLIGGCVVSSPPVSRPAGFPRL